MEIIDNNTVKLVLGSLSTNCYIVKDEDTNDGIIIDPSDEADYIIQIAERLSIKPKYLVATHCHFDHILASLEVSEALNIPFCINKKDEKILKNMNASSKYFLGYDTKLPPAKVEKYLKNNDVLNVGNIEFKIIETPGHSPGSITLYSKLLKSAFVGDVVFSGGSVGSTEFKYCNKENLATSIKKILSLPQDTKIFSGHGDITSVEEIKNTSLLDNLSV